jgi:hypothetical protein
MLCVFIIVLLALYVLYTQRSGPTDGTNEKIHPVETDTLSDVIDRIEWSLLRENRINYPLRYLAWGLWVTFLGSYMITNTLPTPGTFLRTWIVTTIVLLSFHGFYHWHTDKFSSFAGLSALEKARGMLGLKRGDFSELKSSDRVFTGEDPPWTFTHTDYMLGTRSPYGY